MSDATLDSRATPAAVIQTASQRQGYWHSVGRKLRRDPVTIMVGVVLLCIVATAVFAPLVAGADPDAGSILTRLAPTGAPGHWLGTDENGRDMWARLCYGGRLSLIAGASPVAVALLVGGLLGVIAGHKGGFVNALIMRVMGEFYAFPSVLLAIAICGVLGNGLTDVIIALSAVFIPPLARISETIAAQVRRLEFVEAARASGTSSAQVIRHHVLPNVLVPILVYATSLISVSIILASGLRFLGLGVVPPTPEWGVMLNALRAATYAQPYVSALPGVMLFLTSMCFNLLSDGLRSAMDVKLNT